jgi:hypothetical protein
MPQPNELIIASTAPILLRPMPTNLSGGHSELEPPDPIPNSEVKRLCADDSVGLLHAKVGHRQAPITKPPSIGGLLFVILNTCAKLWFWKHNNSDVIERICPSPDAFLGLICVVGGCVWQ